MHAIYAHVFLECINDIILHTCSITVCDEMKKLNPPQMHPSINDAIIYLNGLC